MQILMLISAEMNLNLLSGFIIMVTNQYYSYLIKMVKIKKTIKSEYSTKKKISYKNNSCMLCRKSTK